MGSKYIHHLNPRKEHTLNIVRFVCFVPRDPADRSKKNRYIRGYDEKRSSFLDLGRFYPLLAARTLNEGLQGLRAFTKKFL